MLVEAGTWLLLAWSWQLSHRLCGWAAVFVCIAERVWVSEVQGRWEEVKEGKQKRICFKSKPFDAEIA